MRSATGALITIAARKSQALLAYLGARPAQRVSRDKLASLLWSSTGPDQARQSLRQTLSGLRKELSQISKERMLIEEGDLLGLEETLVDVDVATFEQLVGSGSEEALARAFRSVVARRTRPAASHGAARARAARRDANAPRCG
jgi:DNA-binding SARP family transcriptional activator